MLRFSLVASALIIIAVGAFLTLTGSAVGVAVAAFGVVDLLTVPLVLRTIGKGQRDAELDAAAEGTPQVEPPVPPAPDPSADPSYNPYAEED